LPLLILFSGKIYVRVVGKFVWRWKNLGGSGKVSNKSMAGKILV